MSPSILLAVALLPGLQDTGYAKAHPTALKVSIFKSAAATLQLPALGTRSPLCDLAEKSVSDAERYHLRLWIKETRELLEDLPEFRDRVSYDGGAELKFDDARLLSFRAEVAYYSGGAHGMTNARTYNFGFVEGKPSRFGVEQAFLRDKASRVALQELLVGRAGKMEGTDWIAEGMVRYLSDTQLSRFWVDRDALVWEFDPYELGPYAAGPFTLRVPRADLVALIREDGPLGFWAKR